MKKDEICGTSGVHGGNKERGGPKDISLKNFQLRN
jgi:hypothetical protein